MITSAKLRNLTSAEPRANFRWNPDKTHGAGEEKQRTEGQPGTTGKDRPQIDVLRLAPEFQGCTELGAAPRAEVGKIPRFHGSATARAGGTNHAGLNIAHYVFIGGHWRILRKGASERIKASHGYRREGPVARRMHRGEGGHIWKIFLTWARRTGRSGPSSSAATWASMVGISMCWGQRSRQVLQVVHWEA
jgi:hypothetical protein